MKLAVLVALSAAALFGQTGRPVVYAALGAVLIQYDLDPNSAALTRRGIVALPANVQEAWIHPSHKYLYVAWSNGGASYPAAGGVTPRGDRHGISTFQIDPTSGALVLHGKPAALPSRPIFITTDVDGSHVLAAYNDPSGLTVHRLMADGTIGSQVEQAAKLDFGIYGHQVRMDPSNQAVILVTRGNGPTATKPEDPGALKLFNYKDGVLTNRVSIAPAGGFGYQVRHLDFHPSGKWAFVTLERQNQIHVYARKADGTLGSTPLFVRDTIREPGKKRSGQMVASIHVHPNGRFVYVANRAGAGGENTVGVFSINGETGEPTLIQSIDTQGFQPRTFALDASGSFLVVANQTSVGTVPASLALFRVGNDGKLEFARKVDMGTTATESLFWAGMISLL
jgi:6-phosphogluconolactonase